MPDLGYKPPSDYNLNLGSAGRDNFNLTLYGDEPWPDGTTVTIVIEDSTGAQVVSWPATVTDVNIVWSLDAAVIAALATLTSTAKSLVVLYLYADATGAEQTWFTGKVKWFA